MSIAVKTVSEDLQVHEHETCRGSARSAADWHGATATAAVVSVDRDSPVPLFRQLEGSLRLAIMDGLLRPGTRLPSSRALAEALAISRNTIVLAFEDLLAQGFLVARTGAGTFVADQPPRLDVSKSNEHEGTFPTPRLSRRGERLAQLSVTKVRQLGPAGAFRCGVPALDVFSHQAWLRQASKARSTSNADLLGYGETAGYRPLRKAIADYVSASRAVRCSVEQVVIVSGSQQGLDLSARLLVDQGDPIWVEDPARSGAIGAFAAADLDLVHIPLDDEGLRVDIGIERAPNVRMAYVSPSHQFPTGMTMSLRRRQELVNWAERTDSWIIEDDHDSEFHFDGSPLPSIQGLAPHRTIYVGTLSRVLFPSLRLGYVIVPEDVLDAFEHARALVDRQSSSRMQAAVARFINDGEFDRHLRKMHNVYVGRREALFHHADHLLQGLLSLRRDSSGLHVVGFLPPDSDDVAAEETAARHGIDVSAMSPFVSETTMPPSLILGYGVVPEQAMEAAVAELARALTSSLCGSS